MKKIPLRKLINGKRTAFLYALVDDADFDVVAGHHWHVSSTGYAAATIGGKRHYMHRMIMNPPNAFMVDHIDGDKLNNQRANLRICTNGENMRNKLEMSGNKSGHRGVCRKKNHRRWTATIKLNKRNIHLGYFDTAEEAIGARLKAETEHFGAFAPNRKTL